MTFRENKQKKGKIKRGICKRKKERERKNRK
jgi:hypothetical protein